MWAFFCKKLAFFPPKSTFTESNSVRALLEIFSSLFSFCKTKGYYCWKHIFADSVSGIRPPDCSKLARNPKNNNDVTLFRHDVNVFLFLLSSLVTARCFMSISSQVLELWQFSFIRDWPELRKSEIPPSEFWPISGDWGELWVLNLARMSFIKCYWMLQNSRVTAVFVLELLRENQLGGGNYPTSPPTQIRTKTKAPMSLNMEDGFLD